MQYNWNADDAGKADFRGFFFNDIHFLNIIKKNPRKSALPASFAFQFALYLSKLFYNQIICIFQ